MTLINGVSINNQTTQEQQNKASAGKVAGGFILGNAVYGYGKSMPLRTINPKLAERMKQLSDGLTKDQIEIVNKATDKLVETAGLSGKGVGIIKATSSNMKQVDEIMKKEFSRNKLMKLFPEKIREAIASNQASAVGNGNNAFYASVSKKLVLPEKGLFLSAFHEAGHAMNANLSKIGRILQKSRGAALLSLPIMGIALLKNKKTEGEKPKNFIDKSTDFIKNNAGKLAFATVLPTVIEEGLASFRGHQLAKKLLSPDLVKKVDKSNLLGLATYALLAIGTGLGAHFGVKIRDRIVHGNEQNKNIQKSEPDIKQEPEIKQETENKQ